MIDQSPAQINIDINRFADVNFERHVQRYCLAHAERDVSLCYFRCESGRHDTQLIFARRQIRKDVEPIVVTRGLTFDAGGFMCRRNVCPRDDGVLGVGDRSGQSGTCCLLTENTN